MARIYTEKAAGADTTTILRIVGKLTVGSGDIALPDAVSNAIGSGRRNVILDLADVGSIDSAGIGQMISSYVTVIDGGGALVTSRVPAKLMQLLRMTHFGVQASTQDAVLALLGQRDQAEREGGQAVLESLSYRAEALPPALVLPRLVDSTRLLAEHLLREPQSIYTLPPRRFEELVAELVKQFGWNVQLTPGSRDGGRDIIALIPSAVGDLLCLIEAKRYREDRKVGVGLVRQSGER